MSVVADLTQPPVRSLLQAAGHWAQVDVALLPTVVGQTERDARQRACQRTARSPSMEADQLAADGQGVQRNLGVACWTLMQRSAQRM